MTHLSNVSIERDLSVSSSGLGNSSGCLRCQFILRARESRDELSEDGQVSSGTSSHMEPKGPDHHLIRSKCLVA